MAVERAEKLRWNIRRLVFLLVGYLEDKNIRKIKRKLGGGTYAISGYDNRLNKAFSNALPVRLIS